MSFDGAVSCAGNGDNQRYGRFITDNIVVDGFVAAFSVIEMLVQLGLPFVVNLVFVIDIISSFRTSAEKKTRTVRMNAFINRKRGTARSDHAPYEITAITHYVYDV